MSNSSVSVAAVAAVGEGSSRLRAPTQCFIRALHVWGGNHESSFWGLNCILAICNFRSMRGPKGEEREDAHLTWRYVFSQTFFFLFFYDWGWRRVLKKCLYKSLVRNINASLCQNFYNIARKLKMWILADERLMQVLYILYRRNNSLCQTYKSIAKALPLFTPISRPHRLFKR